MIPVDGPKVITTKGTSKKAAAFLFTVCKMGNFFTAKKKGNVYTTA